MKVNILFTLALCILLSCSSPSVKNHRELSNSSFMDTNIINQDTDINIPHTELETGTYYLNINSHSDVTYIIDDKYCIHGREFCLYTYNPDNNVISISWKGIASKNKEEFMYYMVLSGYQTKLLFERAGMSKDVSDYFHLTSNIQNPSFALIEVDKSSRDGNFTTRNNVNLYKSINSEIEKEVTITTSNMIEDVKRAMSQHQSFMMPLENKIDILESKGKEKVDALLNNKVEYNYSSIMKTWDNLTNNGLKINNFINKDLNILDTKVKELPAILTLYKQLDSDRENLNKILDNEILPILQQ